MEMNNMKEKKKSGCIIFLVILVIVLMTAMVAVMYFYAKDPINFQTKIEGWTNQLLSIVEQNTGLDLGSQKPVVEEKIEFPDVEELTEAQKYYYYQQLDDTSKKIYLTIENNIDRLKNSDDEIPLPASLNEVANGEDGKNVVSKEFQKAWDAFIMDRSEYFYLDSSKVCLVTKVTTTKKGSTYEFFISKDK